MGTNKGNQIVQLAAATNSGEAGACLFAVDRRGRISFTQQASPGGPWRGWQGPSFQGQLFFATALACADQNNGCLMLVALATNGSLWSLAQDSPSGVWGAWQGPMIAGQKFSYRAIAAGGQTGTHGLQLVAADFNGFLSSCYQVAPGGGWSGWSPFAAGGSAAGRPSEVALAGQNNGCLMLMARAEGKISAAPQAAPSGNWGNWIELGSDDFGMSLSNICACQQGGSRGAQLWALDGEGQVWTIFQDSAGSAWDTWQGPGFLNQPPGGFAGLAAAGQNNGSSMLFAVTRTGDLWLTGQQGPGGNWDPWREMVLPPP